MPHHVGFNGNSVPLQDSTASQQEQPGPSRPVGSPTPQNQYGGHLGQLGQMRPGASAAGEITGTQYIQEMSRRSAHPPKQAGGDVVNFQRQITDEPDAPSLGNLGPPSSVRHPPVAAQVLRDRLIGLEVTVLPNEGVAGDVAIMSGMYRIKGMQPEAAKADARKLYLTLASQGGDIGVWLRSERGLHTAPQVFQFVAEQIFEGNSRPPMLIMVPGEHGVPSVRNPFDRDQNSRVAPSEILHDTVMFLQDSNRHFDVLANTGARPWRELVGELQTAPDQQALQTIRAVREMEVPVIAADGTVLPRTWKMGVQLALKMDAERPSDPLKRARELAKAQHIVDGACAALQQRLPTALRNYRWSEDGTGEALDLTVQSTTDNEDYYELSLQFRQDRITHMVVKSNKAGTAKAGLENPWTRRELRSLPQHGLKLAEDLDYLDQLTLLRGDDADLACLSSLLLLLRRDGKRLDDLRHWTPESLGAYLMQKVNDAMFERDLLTSVVPVLRRLGIAEA